MLPVTLLAFLLSTHCIGAASAAQEDPVKCSACEAVADDLAKLNATTSTAEIIKLLEGEYCDVVYAHSPAKRLACDAAAKGLGAAYAAARKEIASLAWSPRNLCGVAGICTFDCCNPSNTPEQVHISITDDPTEMTAMWTTLRQTTNDLVQWGKQPGQLSAQSDAKAGASSTYTHFGWIGMFHRATMTHLAPGTRYYYRVGSRNPAGANESSWSQVFSFRTLPAVSNTDAKLVVASVGDMGYGPASDDTVMRLTELVAAEKIDVVVHNGDISYADGDYTHWDIFMRKIEPVAAQVPYMVSPGNHEFYFNFSAYKHRFYMPDRGANDGLYYAFRAGAANFVAMDTESWWDTARMDKREVSFVEKSIDASAQWNVAFGHRPLYASNHGGNDFPHGAYVLRKAIEDVLMKGGVDLVLQAHQHDYERTWPVGANGSMFNTSYASPSFPVYVVNGAAGNREKDMHPPGGKPWQPDMPNVTSSEVSFGLLTVSPRALGWQQVVSGTGQVLDEFEITKRK